MKIEDLKYKIEQNELDDSSYVFIYEDVNFIPIQYVTAMSLAKCMSIEYVDSLTSVGGNTFDIFGCSTSSNNIKVMISSEVESIPESLLHEKNFYVIVHKVKNKDNFERLGSILIDVPKLEEWQIKDYVYSLAEGVDSSKLDWLIDSCNKDIYRLDNELSKIKMFEQNERKFLFEDMISDGAFVDLSSFNIFNVTNSVTTRDYDTLKKVLREIKSFDAEPLGVVTLLYNSFRKLIQVWLANNPTPESTGLKSGMIYAIKNQPKVYNKEQLIKSFLLLTNIDKMLKTGYIDTSWLIDYLICRILTY